jgi:raffinose/stachyose/melibiose transport system permease protein
MRAQRILKVVSGVVGIVVTFGLFVVPFIFIALTAVKSRAEAGLLEFSLPREGYFFMENLTQVIEAREFMLVRAFWNSTVLTVASVALMVIAGAMIAFVLQRRKSRWTGLINALVLAGLIIPPAVVPTIWVMQGLGLFKTLHGLIFIEVAFGIAFCILLFRAFIATIPRELDEAAVIDGAGPIRLFFQVIFPLLRSVIFTVVILQSIFVFNDFQNPLYFLPGDQNATVQLTLFNFQSQFLTAFNLLFMNILIITIPMLVLFLFFNKRIVEGMTAGAVKG